VAFLAAILLVVWMRLVPPIHGIDVLALVGILIGGYPIFKEAISDLLDRRMTMELSMTIALVAASVIGEFFTALLITVFVLIAEILEGMTVGRGRRAIRELLDLLPQTAEVRSGGQVRCWWPQCFRDPAPTNLRGELTKLLRAVLEMDTLWLYDNTSIDASHPVVLDARDGAIASWPTMCRRG